MSEMSEKFENRIIETQDENGTTIKFELIDIIEYNKSEYGLLNPIDCEEEIEEGELALMKLIEQGDEYSFEVIEDDDEFDEVCDYIQSLEEYDDNDYSKNDKNEQN